MFEIFRGLFDLTLLTAHLTPPPDATRSNVFVIATFNTILRATVLAGFTYGAIRVVITAVSHGSF